jgi:hypothetical protein
MKPLADLGFPRFFPCVNNITKIKDRQTLFNYAILDTLNLYYV